MSDIVIVALISLAGTMIGSFAGIVTANKLTAYRIEQLEKKQDKHNGVIERMYKVEEDVALLKEKVTVGNHRIDDLEEFHKPPKQK